MIALTGNPGRKHRNIVRIKCHQVGATTGSKLPEHMLKADKGSRICRRKAQRIRQGHPKQINAVPDRGGHVENGPCQLPVIREAAAVPDSNAFPIKGEAGAAAARPAASHP